MRLYVALVAALVLAPTYVLTEHHWAWIALLAVGAWLAGEALLEGTRPEVQR